MRFFVLADLDATYWNSNGALQALSNKLSKMIPTSGTCPNDKPKLEKFRRAANLYYQLHNNGAFTAYRDENNGKSRYDSISGMFRFASNNLNVMTAGNDRARTYRIMLEEKMTEIIKAAAKEAGIE